MTETTAPSAVAKELGTRRPPKVRENDVSITEGQEVAAATEGNELHVESYVLWFTPDPETDTAPETFTRATFEGALDRVSRPVKGKYADVLPSSEEYIRDKRREAELEDRLS